jgi:hypothetical protein
MDPVLYKFTQFFHAYLFQSKFWYNFILCFTVCVMKVGLKYQEMEYKLWKTGT